MIEIDKTEEFIQLTYSYGEPSFSPDDWIINELKTSGYVGIKHRNFTLTPDLIVNQSRFETSTQEFIENFPDITFNIGRLTVLSDGKVEEEFYRDNHIPLRELSGTVMQLEKYIYFLNRCGKRGEKLLTEKYKDQLPKDFSIHITNPKGFIIMGREEGLSPAQKHDFEVVKRKYRNVIDILSYDDLLQRLKFTIRQIKLR